MTNPATETKSIWAAGRRGACPERSEGCLARPNDRSTKLNHKASSSFGRAGFLTAT